MRLQASLIFWVAAISLYVPSLLAAEVLRYTDEKGVVHFVSRAEDIPERYRSSAGSIAPKTPSPSTEFSATPGNADAKSKLPAGTVAWFSASFGVSGEDVAEWLAKEGDYNLTQKNRDWQPSILRDPKKYPQPLIRFDGVDDFLTGDALAPKLIDTDELTVITVVAVDKEGEQFVWAFHQGDKSGDVVRFGFAGGNRVRVKCTETSKDYIDAEVFDTRSLAVYTTTFDLETVKVYRNGQLVLNRPLHRRISFPQTKYFSLGQEYDRGHPSDFFYGKLGEVMVFTRVLTEVERSAIEQQLIKRYQIS